jgi:hypothetical protein
MFKPVNRYIHIEPSPPQPSERPSGIVLPQDYAPTKETYAVVKVKSWAEDVRFGNCLREEGEILINQSMIEEIIVSNEKFTVILDNYVIGIL